MACRRAAPHERGLHVPHGVGSVTREVWDAILHAKGEALIAVPKHLVLTGISRAKGAG